MVNNNLDYVDTAFMQIGNHKNQISFHGLSGVAVSLAELKQYL